MKRICVFLFVIILVVFAAAWSGNAMPTEAAGDPPVTPTPATPYFVITLEDGTVVSERIEAKLGADQPLNLFFTVKNGEGMVGWDSEAFEKAGITSDMSLDFIEEKGLMIILHAEKETECEMKFFLNGSEDWASPEILYEQTLTIVFTENPTETPSVTPTPATPYFSISYEDGTVASEEIEGKVGQPLNLFFAVENGEGMVGWDGKTFDKAGITSDMSFEYIDEKGLLLILNAKKATECEINFFLNGSEDWANPDILYKQNYTITFSE